MKHLKLLVVLALAICTFTSVNAQSKTITEERVEKTTVYRCAMKCEGSKTYTKPGKCPKCNMKLKAMKVNATAANFQRPMKCEGDKMYAMAGKCPMCNMNLKDVTVKVSEDHKGLNHN